MVAPSHGRVGWNCLVSPKTLHPARSRPLTGAWVGTSTAPCGSPTSRVAPSHGRVGWNSRFATIHDSASCRALSRARGLEREGQRAQVRLARVAPSHGRVGWNSSTWHDLTPSTVAPSHGRVGWNCRVAPHTASPDVAPSHGRVGWNTFAGDYTDAAFESRPLTGAWVGTRGRAHGADISTCRALSRARGLELELPERRRVGVERRALSRARGLELLEVVERRRHLRRALSRARGLEQVQRLDHPASRPVAPSHGRVGWNCRVAPHTASPDVAPSHGRVGWNAREGSASLAESSSALLRACGLELRCRPKASTTIGSRPLAGARVGTWPRWSTPVSRDVVSLAGVWVESGGYIATANMCVWNRVNGVGHTVASSPASGKPHGTTPLRRFFTLLTLPRTPSSPPSPPSAPRAGGTTCCPLRSRACARCGRSRLSAGRPGRGS